MRHILLGSLLLSSLSYAHTTSPTVIYGEDNRKDVYESSSAYIELARSTAAMIVKNELVSSNGMVEVKAPTLQSRGICEKERFSQQITAANCSGFLVDDNKLVTAGHCITAIEDCYSNRWVFDYKIDPASPNKITVPESNVYSCKRIISRSLDPASKNDYAIVELDRPVKDRSPVKFRRSGKVSVGDSLVVIGHPTGLPTKVADGAAVRSLKDKYFVANLDTFGGNSGSAVFNTKTEEVEGILVRGENDYVQDPSGQCQVSFKCLNNPCRGEDVTYITNVPGLP